jgi:fatty acid desaturase
MIKNCLQVRLDEINAKTIAWVAEDPHHRFAGILTDDAEHWKDYGITTGEELDHYLLATDVFERTREVWGFKPNWSVLKGKSKAELEEELIRLEKAADIQERD